MSTYAQFDEDGDQRQIASNLGWSEFGDWCEELDSEEYSNLVQLWEHGQCNDVKRLTKEVETAIAKEKMSDDIKGSAELLLDGLNANQSAGFVLITN